MRPLIKLPVSATTRGSYRHVGLAGERLAFGVWGGVQSLESSSKTEGKSSSSEMMKEVDCPALRPIEEPCGHDG